MHLPKTAETLLSNSNDFLLKSWDIAHSTPFVEWHLSDVPEVRRTPDTRLDSQIGFGSDDQLLRHYHSSGELQDWSTATGELHRDFQFGTEGASTACSDNLGYIAVFKPDLSEGGNLEIWKIEGAQPVLSRQATIANPPAIDDVNHMTISNNGAVVALCLEGAKGALVFKVGSNDLIRIETPSRRLVLSPNGERLAGWNRGSIGNSIWDISGERAEQLASITNSGPVFDGKFSVDAAQFAQAHWNNEIRVIDSLTGEVVHQFSGHAGSAHAVDFSPDGKRLVSGGDDGFVRLWSLDENLAGLVLALSGHQAGVRYVKFSADGNAIASISSDGDARVWKKALNPEDDMDETFLFQLYIEREELNAVRPLLERRVAYQGEGYHPNMKLQLGVLYAYLNDREAHTQYSRELLQRHASTQDPAEADRFAKAYLVIPGPHDPQLLEQAIRLGRRCEELGQEHALYSWFILCRGIAELRAGADAQAVAWLTKVPSDHPDRRSAALAYRAIAEFRMGHTDDAIRLLREAEELIAGMQLPEKHWQNQLISRMAVDEAKSMILMGANPKLGTR